MATQKYSAKDVIYAIEESGGVVVDAAKMLGCSPSTVYNYAQRYVTVQEAIEETRTALYEEAHQCMIAMMRDPTSKDHRWAVERILRTYGEHVEDGLEWSDKARHEKQDATEPIPLQWGPPELSEEELDWDAAEQ